MADWIRSQFDTVHALEAQLSDANGPLDIPPGVTASFVGVSTFQSTTSVTKIGGHAVIVRPGATYDDPNRGYIRYDLTSTDMALPGIYFCQWKLHPPYSTQIQSFPEDSYLVLVILPSSQ